VQWKPPPSYPLGFHEVIQMLTQSQVQHVLKYDADTGVFTWIVPTNTRIKAGDVAGCMNDNGYLRIQVLGKQYKFHRLAWLYVYGQFPDCEIDHVNGNRADNRIENLRLATSKQNKENVKLNSRSTTGYRGVHWDKSRQKWLAHVTSNRKHHNLGRFDDVNDAINAVKQARNQLFSHHNTCYSS
jgi:hypothetical protein